MNLYLIIFTAGTYKVEQVYEKHKDLFVELEKHFTLHLVNYTDSESIPSHEYKTAFIASGGVFCFLSPFLFLSAVATSHLC